jgi:hypothetical protein
VDWRPAYLRGVLARYGIAERPLLRTEGALLCPGAIGGQFEHSNAAERRSRRPRGRKRQR